MGSKRPRYITYFTPTPPLVFSGSRTGKACMSSGRATLVKHSVGIAKRAGPVNVPRNATILSVGIPRKDLAFLETRAYGVVLSNARMPGLILYTSMHVMRQCEQLVEFSECFFFSPTGTLGLASAWTVNFLGINGKSLWWRFTRSKVVPVG